MTDENHETVDASREASSANETEGDSSPSGSPEIEMGVDDEDLLADPDRPKLISWSDINSVTIREVVDEIGMTQESNGRWICPGEVHKHGAKTDINFADNVFYHHEGDPGHGGGPVELAAHYLEQLWGNQHQKPTRAEKRRAAEWLAERRGLWLDGDKVREKSRVIPDPEVDDAILDPRGMDARRLSTVHLLLEESDPRREAAQRWVEAVGLDWDRITLAVSKSGICVTPCIPYGGSRTPSPEADGWDRLYLKVHKRRDWNAEGQPYVDADGNPCDEEDAALKVPDAGLEGTANYGSGGWGSDLAEAELAASEDAGRIWVLDLDGRGGGTDDEGNGKPLKRRGKWVDENLDPVESAEDAWCPPKPLPPTLEAIQWIARQMGERGFPACSVEVTTPDPDEDRAKAHITFACAPDQRVTSASAYESRYELLRQTYKEVLQEGIKNGVVDKFEAASGVYDLDHAMRQINRQKRLRGCRKPGKEWKVTGIRTDPDARVDFKTVEETAPIEVGSGSTVYEIGPKCTKIKRRYDAENNSWEPYEWHDVAKEVWPVAMTDHHEGGHRGVRYRYHDAWGGVRYGVIHADAWMDTYKAKTVAGEAAKSGVQTEPGRGRDFAEMLGKWAQECGASADRIVEVTSSGWADEHIYVNGPDIVGMADEASSSAPADSNWTASGKHTVHRGGRAGELEDWIDGLKRLATATGNNVRWNEGEPIRLFAAGIGVSLVGALVEPLGLQPWGLHLCGASSAGKTKALMWGASIWGNPRRTMSSWQGTANGHEISAAMMDGACLTIDEIQEGDAWQIHKFVYMFSDGEGKKRQKRGSNELRETRRWASTMLSSGENSAVEQVGPELVQGGFTTRLVDFRVRDGEGTESGDHATEIERFVEEAHGTAWRPWVEWVMERDTAELRDRYDDIRRRLAEGIESGENVRILQQLAQVELALVEAVEAGLIPWTSEQMRDCVEWLSERVIGERGDQTRPEPRAYARLKAVFETSPKRFPASKLAVQRTDQMIGVRRKPEHGSIHTSASLLRESGICREVGTTPERLLEWCEDRGLATWREDAEKGRKRYSVHGMQRRWCEVELFEDAEEADETPSFEDFGNVVDMHEAEIGDRARERAKRDD
jgi:hypothetical protein